MDITNDMTICLVKAGMMIATCKFWKQFLIARNFQSSNNKLVKDVTKKKLEAKYEKNWYQYQTFGKKLEATFLLFWLKTGGMNQRRH